MTEEKPTTAKPPIKPGGSTISKNNREEAPRKTK